MPRLTKLLALAVLLVVTGCHKAPKPAAAPEADYDWSSYKGGAGDDVAKSDGKSDSKAEGSAAKADSTKSDTAAEKSVDLTPGKPSLADASGPKKASKGKIRGKSVSVVDAEALAGASKTALKSKVVSSNVITGPEYEMVQIVLKDASVQIVRPAVSPDQAGPKLRSPKVRNDSLSSTESGWYDADADVLVLVQSTKAAKSKKALGAILKR